MKSQRLKYDVSEFQGYVKARILTNYWRLPDHAKGALGIDDCCQEALLYLHKALNGLDGFNETYDKTKSKLTTFIYRCIDSYFSRAIGAQMSNMRSAFLVTIDELPKQPAMEENATVLAKKKEAIDKVVKLHLDASPELMDFIAANLYSPKRSNQFKVNVTSSDFKSVIHSYTHKPRKVKCSASEVFAKRKAEFIYLAKRHDVTADHYRLVLAGELK